MNVSNRRTLISGAGIRRFVARGSVALAALASVTGCTAVVEDDESEVVATVHEALDVSRFRGWKPIPNGLFNTGPGIARPNNGIKMVCGVGQDNRVWCNEWRSGTGWQPDWTQISPDVVSNAGRPAVTSYTDEAGLFQWAVAVLATDGQVLINRTISSGWTGFTRLRESTGFIIGLAMVPGRLGSTLLFGTKSDGRYYQGAVTLTALAQSRPSWGPFSGRLVFASAPTAILMPGGRLAVAGMGTDRRYYLDADANFDIHNLQVVGAQTFESTPGLAARNNTQVELFGTMEGEDAVRVATVNPDSPGSPTFSLIPDGLFNTPAMAGASSTEIDVVGRGLDNAFWINHWQ